MTTFAKASFLSLLLLLSVSHQQVDGLTSAPTQHSSISASFSIRRRDSPQRRQPQPQLQNDLSPFSHQRRRTSTRLASTCRSSDIDERSSSSLLHHQSQQQQQQQQPCNMPSWLQQAHKMVAAVSVATVLSASLFFSVAFAENELSAKYGGSFDSSLVDQTCLVDHCSLHAKACLADDPSCRKGLTCTAKCLGDNACITGCMARYGNKNLDNLLKCTIEDHECIKVAILDGGADPYGEEPRSPGPTLANFNYKTLEGTWYKVVGYNPNYDCYACQRNTFTVPTSNNHRGNNNNNNNNNKLFMDVEFSMPHLMPDGSPPPPASVRESIQLTPDETMLFGSQSIGLNDYNTHETMVFDTPSSSAANKDLVLKKQGTNQQVSYARTAHSEGEMFGLKFWENWYILGENDPGTPEFKFIYYNGKTRQNTYEGAFVYSRTRDLSPTSLQKVYQIAQDAGMNPKQFCRIRNGCFQDDPIQQQQQQQDQGSFLLADPFRGILASTKVSQLLGVEPVKAEGMMRKAVPTARILTPNDDQDEAAARPWWYEVGDYLENPHRHFQAMDQLRVPMEWPESVMNAVAGRVEAASTTTTTMARK